MPFDVTVAPQGNGWLVTVDNHSATTLTNVKLALGDTLMDVGEFPANQAKSISVTRSNSRSLEDFVTAYGGDFQQKVQSRRNALGSSERGQITDLPDASMAVSFVSLGVRSGPNENFSMTGGRDLANTVQHGGAVLLAWSDDYSPSKPMNQFSPRRTHRYTLWRVPVKIPGS